MPFVYAYGGEELGSISREELQSISLVFSNLAPRGSGTRPFFGTMIYSPVDAPIALGVPVPFRFKLDLCDRSEEVTGTLRFDTGTQTADRLEPPLSGEVRVDADGWSLAGHFQVNDLCGRPTGRW